MFDLDFVRHHAGPAVSVRGDASESGYRTLGAILDRFAEREGDLDARIAIRRKDLSSGRYLELARFCFDQGRKDEALIWAREGVWVFEDDRPDERLIDFYAARLAETGEAAEAERVLWAAFERAPSLSLYERLKALAGASGVGRVLDCLGGRTRSGAGHRLNIADLHVQILMREGMADAAWAAVEAHGASEGVCFTLATSTATTHPRQALTIFAERVERLVSGGSGYEEAAKLIGEMSRLRDPSVHARYLQDVKDRHRRKRNFMTLLG